MMQYSIEGVGRAVIPHRGDRGCLMAVKPHILRRSLHESRSLPWSLGSCRLHGSSKERAFNMRYASNPSADLSQI